MPNILRTFGRGEVVLPDSERWNDLFPHFDPLIGARQIIVNHISEVQTSCGFAVPLFDYQGERDTARKWAETKGEDGPVAYRGEKNMCSLDGLPTPLSTMQAD